MRDLPAEAARSTSLGHTLGVPCTTHVRAYLEALDRLVASAYSDAHRRQRALDELRDAFMALRACPDCWAGYLEMRASHRGSGVSA